MATYGNRYQKKKTPYGWYFFFLVIFLLFGYLVSGLYAVPGISLDTLQESFVYVCLHPLRNWNERTPACLALAFLAWLMFVGYMMTRYRNFHLATEHGSSYWLDARAASRELADEDETYNRILTENVKISLRGKLSNNNALVIGSSGSYKTTSFLQQNLLQRASAYVVLDVKGDTQRNLGRAMQEAGYTIKSLNFKEPEKSDRINPFVNIEREDDLLRVVQSIHSACRPKNTSSTADPFWDDAVDAYLNALFYYVWLDNRDKGSVGTMTEVVELCNLESQKSEDPETGETISELGKLMDLKAEQYGPGYPPVREYRKLIDGAPDTVRSVILMVNAMLNICETGEVKRIFSANDINIREIGTGVGGDPEKKIVLFLVIPDNNNVYNWIVSMFYTQMFDILIRLSDSELHAPLPIPVEFHLDEFYAGARPADPDKLLGVVRSRNISMIPYLQSISQIKTLFRDDKWETIMDNVAAVVYLGSGPLAESTHKYISEALGKTTVDSMSDSMQKSGGGINYSRTGMELMKPDEVKRMPRTEAIVFLESRPPIYDTKAIPFDQPALSFKAVPWLRYRYQKALSLGPYEHPVYTVYDPIRFEYITVRQDKRLQILTNKKEIQTYQEAAKRDPHIFAYTVDEQDLLYLNWGQTERSPEEVESLFRAAVEAEQKKIEDIRGLAVLQDVDGGSVLDFGTLEETDKSGWGPETNLRRLLNNHWEELSAEEQEIIGQAIDDGLTEEQLCQLALKPFDEMDVWRRACILKNNE